MRGPLLLLVTSFAASVVAAPVPVSAESPVEVAEPLMAREPSDSTASPLLDVDKRTLLEKLDTIIETKRTVPAREPTATNGKRNPMHNGGAVPPGAIDKREPKSENTAKNLDRRDPKSENTANNLDRREPKSENTAKNLDRREPKSENTAKNLDRREPKSENTAKNLD